MLPFKFVFFAELRFLVSSSVYHWRITLFWCDPKAFSGHVEHDNQNYPFEVMIAKFDDVKMFMYC